jgi:hypothetical protein
MPFVSPEFMQQERVITGGGCPVGVMHSTIQELRRSSGNPENSG